MGEDCQELIAGMESNEMKRHAVDTIMKESEQLLATNLGVNQRTKVLLFKGVFKASLVSKGS